MEGKQFSISDAEYFVFHSPYNKVTYVRNWLREKEKLTTATIWAQKSCLVCFRH